MTALLDETLRRLDDCGCCEGIGPSVPGVVFNRPGLSAIAYRSATWHEFRSSLIAALSHRDHPALAGLTTRDGDDFTIALLDAVAAMGDVLTFYGERIATESYLRTATERRSILELARLIGYELEAGRGGEHAGRVHGRGSARAGGRGAGPTGGDRRRRGEGPEHPRSRGEAADVRDHRADRGPGGMEHAAAEAGWTAGDRRQPGVARARRHGYQAPAGRHGAARQRAAGTTVADADWEARRVARVSTDFTASRTTVALDPGSAKSTFAPSAPVQAYAMRTRAAAFGYNAADWKTLSASFKKAYLGKARFRHADRRRAEGVARLRTVFTTDVDGRDIQRIARPRGGPPGVVGHVGGPLDAVGEPALHGHDDAARRDLPGSRSAAASREVDPERQRLRCVRVPTRRDMVVHAQSEAADARRRRDRPTGHR